jgi:hypothetical protein
MSHHDEEIQPIQITVCSKMNNAAILLVMLLPKFDLRGEDHVGLTSRQIRVGGRAGVTRLLRNSPDGADVIRLHSFGVAARSRLNERLAL